MAEKDEKMPQADEAKDTESQTDGETRPARPDVALKFLDGLSSNIKDEPVSAKEARRLLWKIDLIILPILAFSVIIAAVDKIVISNAAIYGMRTDLALTGNQFSWVGSVFYFGFLVSEWPGNILIQKLAIRKLYAVTVFGWAVMTFLTGAAQNFAGLATIRFISEFYRLSYGPYWYNTN